MESPIIPLSLLLSQRFYSLLHEWRPYGYFAALLWSR